MYGAVLIGKQKTSFLSRRILSVKSTTRESEQIQNVLEEEEEDEEAHVTFQSTQNMSG